MEVQWFPGHMAKALRETKDKLKLVDMVIETCDARIPVSSRNPRLDEILGEKPRLIVLNKSDLAEDRYTASWIEYFRSRNINAIAAEGTDRNSVKKIIDACTTICAEKIRRAIDKGQLIRPVRAMVVGIPNTGKSSIINTISARKATITSDRPGVTRSAQWVRSGDKLELMDMPGVLWPKIDRKESQILLAATGAIKDTVLDVTEIAYESMGIMWKLYPDLLTGRYRIEHEGVFDAEVFENAAKLRGCIRSGGKIDTERFANLFLDEFRSGKAGKMTFERP
ncbi:MAG: ribosome biogenesis GTPase YlqF [Saccharofermentanales bacterium]